MRTTPKITRKWLMRHKPCGEAIEYHEHVLKNETNAVVIARRLVADHKMGWVYWFLPRALRHPLISGKRLLDAWAADDKKFKKIVKRWIALLGERKVSKRRKKGGLSCKRHTK